MEFSWRCCCRPFKRRESARRTSCANNLKQIGTALQDYHTAKLTFPAGVSEGCYRCDPWNWTVFILDYMEESNLAARLTITGAQPTTSPNTLPDLSGPASKIIPTFLCPSTSRLAPFRTADNLLGDFDQNHKWSNGEGMACMDYGAVDGPSNTLINQFDNNTPHKAYGNSRGVLLNINAAKNAPGVHVATKIGIRRITDGTSHTMMVVEITGRGYNIRDKVARAAWAGGLANPGTAGAKSGNNTCAMQDRVNLPEPPPNPTAHTAWLYDEIFSDHPGGASSDVRRVRAIPFRTDRSVPDLVPCLARRKRDDSRRSLLIRDLAGRDSVFPPFFSRNPNSPLSKL